MRASACWSLSGLPPEITCGSSLPDPARVANVAPIWEAPKRKEYDFSRGVRGPVVTVPKGKTRITIRLDDDVLDWFYARVHEAGGGSYQSLINDALRRHIERTAEPLEATLRRVVREELCAAPHRR